MTDVDEVMTTSSYLYFCSGFAADSESKSKSEDDYAIEALLEIPPVAIAAAEVVAAIGDDEADTDTDPLDCRL